MKKIFSIFIVLSILSISIVGTGSNSCDTCSKGRVTLTKSCHSQKKVVETKFCCTQDTSQDEKSCHTDSSFPNDCQICAHTDPPPAKIEASVNLKVDKKIVVAIPVTQHAFSNQIPPLGSSCIISTSSPPVIANCLVILEPIRLLI